MEKYDLGEGKINSKEANIGSVLKVPNHIQDLVDFLTKTTDVDNSPIEYKSIFRNFFNLKMYYC